MSVVARDYNSVDWTKHFYYDITSNTGLRNLHNRGKAKIYSQSGSVRSDKAGYKSITVKVNGSFWVVARIIWILHNGNLSNDLVIDHIDGNSLNNRIENLRVVYKAINSRNASKRNDNSTGTTGVCFDTIVSSSGRVHTNVRVYWYSENRTLCHKSFSTSKYGLIPAFALAVQHREKQINIRNIEGAGYTQRHGN